MLVGEKSQFSRRKMSPVWRCNLVQSTKPNARRGSAPDCAYDEGGRRIERRHVRQLDPAARSMHVELRWYADGVPTGEQASCSMKISTRDELAALVARAGLQLVDIYGDFDRSPHEAARPRELVVVATKPA